MLERPKKRTNRKKLDSFTDLTPGDLVVHEHHGIGRYVGMEQLKVGGVIKGLRQDRLSGHATVLYVPATQLDLVSKYIGCAARIRPSASISSAATSGRRQRPRPRPRPRTWPRA